MFSFFGASEFAALLIQRTLDLLLFIDDSYERRFFFLHPSPALSDPFPEPSTAARSFSWSIGNLGVPFCFTELN